MYLLLQPLQLLLRHQRRRLRLQVRHLGQKTRYLGVQGVVIALKLPHQESDFIALGPDIRLQPDNFNSQRNPFRFRQRCLLKLTA